MEQKAKSATETDTRGDITADTEGDITADTEGDIDVRCGYGSCHPGFLQRFNNSKFMLAVMCFYVFSQGKASVSFKLYSKTCKQRPVEVKSIFSICRQLKDRQNGAKKQELAKFEIVKLVCSKQLLAETAVSSRFTYCK